MPGPLAPTGPAAPPARGGVADDYDSFMAEMKSLGAVG
jgi:hypothetical protein